MVAINEGQQVPGDPNDPSTIHLTFPRYVLLSASDDTPVSPDSSACDDTPVRPYFSTSDQSSSSGFASQLSYDGGVTLPSASIVDNPSHDHSQRTPTNHTGASNAQVHAPTPVRFIRNISIHGPAHANTADAFPSGPTVYRAGPEISAPQPALQDHVNLQGNFIINGAVHASSADVFTGGLNAHRVGSGVSRSQPTFQVPINGNRTGTVNIPKSDRIYGNLKDNRLSSLNKGMYGNGNRNTNSRTYRNGVPRRTRGDNRIQGPPQATAGGFGNSNAFAPDGSRPPRVGYNAPQKYPANRMLFQESPNNQVYNYQASNYQASNYQASNYQASNYQPPNYQASNIHPSNIHPSNSHPSNSNPSNGHPSNGHPSNGHPSDYPASTYPAPTYQSPNYPASNHQVSNSQAFNSQASNHQASNDQAFNYSALNFQASTSQASTSQSFNIQSSTSQSFNSQSFNSQSINSQSINSQFINSQSSNNQVSALRAQIPHQTQFSTPLTMLSAPPDPFAAPLRAKGAAIAALILSGATSDGRPLDPDARTPTTGSDRPRTNSVQLDTPTRPGGSRGSRHNGYGSHAAGVYSLHTLRTSNFMRGTWAPPAWLHEASTQPPTLDAALTSLPFSNPYEKVPFRGEGVVKFTNIPYETLKSELIAALGRNARPLNMPLGSPYYAAHIIMDRHTGKSGDGFVEFGTAKDARNIVRAINRRAKDGSRSLKIGNRKVVVQVSSPGELMAALFPHVDGAVEWKDYTPHVIEVDTLFYQDQPRGVPLTGFCSSEELAALVKFAENQSRSAFVQRTPYRLYECIISTLHRFPWHTPCLIPLAQRKKLYDTVRHCMQILVLALDRDERDRHIGISDLLLQEFATAALSCVGFSEQQKATLVEELAAAGKSMGRDMNVHLGGNGILSASWPFLALNPQAFVDERLLKFYVSLISKASEVDKNTSLYDVSPHLEDDPKPFGRFAVDYNSHYNSRDMVNLSLEKVVRAELDAVVRVLSSVLLGGCSYYLYELE